MEMTGKQLRIYEGLRQIGEEISDFYLDACTIVNDQPNLRSKANVLAHLTREISAGFIDIFAPKESDEQTNFLRIVQALGCDEAEPIAKTWFGITKRLPRVAHRRGAWKTTRDPLEALKLWESFEGILSYLMGSFYGIVDRLERLSSYPSPTPEMLETVKNLIAVKQSEQTFFLNLNQPGWLKPLRTAGFFETENAPIIIQSEGPLYPHWLSLRYLQNLCKLHDLETDGEILDIVRKIQTDCLQSNILLHPYAVSDIAQIAVDLKCHTFEQIDHDFFAQAIAQLPGEDYHIAPILIENLVGKYLTNGDSAGMISFLKFVFGFTISKTEGIYFEELDSHLEPYPEITYLVSESWIRDNVLSNAEAIGKMCGAIVIENAVDTVLQISAVSDHQFNGIASIEPSSQSSYGQDLWELTLVHFIEKCLCSSSTKELRRFVADFYQSDRQILNRLAFHLTRLKSAELLELFWEFVAANPLTSSIHRHELFLLIQHISKDNDEEHFTKLLKWADNYEDKEDENEATARYRYYSIRKWLEAFEPSESNLVQKLDIAKKKYLELNSDPIEHPSFDSYGTTTHGNEFPTTYEVFSALDLQDQITYIVNFKQDEWHLSYEDGLAQLLKASIVENSSKYLFELSVLLPLHSQYLYQVVDAFTLLAENRTIVDISAILEFIESAVEPSRFTAEVDKHYSYKKWLAHSIARFINTVVATDLVDEKILDRCAALLLSLLDKKELEDADTAINHGYYNHILNSTKGRLLAALMQLTKKRISLLDLSKEPEKWSWDVKDYFTRNLERKPNQDKDISIALGVYFPFLLYVDSNWTKSNIDAIFPIANPEHFTYTFDSFWESSPVTARAFAIIQENGLDDIAIQRFNTSSEALTRLIEYTLNQHLFEKVTLDDPKSFLRRLLENRNPAQLETVVEVIGRSQNLGFSNVEDIAKRLIEIVEEDKEKFRPLARILTWLAGKTDQLTDEVIGLIDYSLDYFDENDGDAFHLAKEILEKSASDYLNAGKLLIRLYKQTNTQIFFEDQVVQLVSNLFDRGFIAEANAICQYFAAKGNLALKSLFNKHNQPS